MIHFLLALLRSEVPARGDKYLRKQIILKLICFKVLIAVTGILWCFSALVNGSSNYPPIVADIV
jgi:hypothetical protein